MQLKDIIKKIGFLAISTCITVHSPAQPGKKPASSKQPATSQPDMNKMLEDAMKAEGMSKEEQEEMKKMMKDVMPVMEQHNATIADYPEFNSNKQLIPGKDAARIAGMSKKKLTKTEVAAYATNLYNKMMGKAEAAEMAIVKKVIAQTPKATDIGSAAVLAMLQGHPLAALALSIKAVALDPANLNWQNNMAALLTSYGYPEQAMPLLRKLQDDLPLNSTVLNNLGQAWLEFGEPDSAKRFFAIANRINPYHPDAKLCGGLMEELQGDPIKADDSYKEALENSPNPFTEQVLKNHNKNYKAQDLDFEKIKKLIAIYEYFPKNWMPEPPQLSNSVKNYNEDYGTKKAYADMVSNFKNKIDLMADELDQEVQETFNKGEEAFIKEMAAETMKGLSFISKPATIVLGVLSSYQLKWQLENTEELKKMWAWKEQLNKEKQQKIDAIYKKISDSKGTRCETFKAQLDGLENDYMRKVNTRLRDYLIKKTEEFRQWLNAWCTWNWYVAGNVKNTVLLQDIGFTGYLAELYGSITDGMETLTEHCSPPVYQVKREFPEPQIPNFTCPAVVSIPAGPEWQQLVAASKDFNKNGYGIKKTNNPVPNVTVATGVGKMVAQPGISPSYKTANGSITPGTADVEAAMDKGLLAALRRVNGNPKPTDGQVGDAIDKGLSDAMKRMQERRKQGVLGDDDELVPLPNIPKDELTPLDPKLLNKYKLFKELMNNMLTADCKNVKTPKENLKDQLDKMMKKVRELDAFETMMDEIKRLEKEIAEKESNAQKKEEMRKKIEEFQKASDELDKFEEMQEFLKRAEKFGKEMDEMDEKKAFRENMQKIMQMVEEMENTPALINEIRQNGLQPSISSGLQSPGTFNTQKNLFN